MLTLSPSNYAVTGECQYVKSSFKELLMKLKQYLHECYTDSFRTNGLKAVYGELLEFIEAIIHFRLKEALYELRQVCLYLLIFTSYVLERVSIKFNPSIPNWMPWRDDYKRIEVWKKILHISHATNQTLNLEWFNKGNNWRRPSKVVYVLSQAGLYIDEKEAKRLIKLVEEEN